MFRSRGSLQSHREVPGRCDMTEENDLEFAAMQGVYAALAPLDPDARARVLDYISSRLGVAKKAAILLHDEVDADGEEEVTKGEESAVQNQSFSTFAELSDAAQPKNGPEKALVAGYWLQVCQGSESFDGFSANKELKNLGEGVGNITTAIDGLKSQKPALVLQLKKSGKSKQARKTYKVTVAGIKAVEGMINGR